MTDFKTVSVIIPTYNEEDTIADCIRSLTDTDYPIDKLEFIIADGSSSDNTLKNIEGFSAKNPDAKIDVVHNPGKTQGYGLNIAIENVSKNSEVIVRADAHSVYPPNYISDCVRSLWSTNADNVGGVMVPLGKGYLQRAVSFCMSHPLGVGNAKFHLGNYCGFVDTVYLGCFRKEVFEKVGLFDPAMTPNEDAEFNMRIRKSGGTVYLNGDIEVGYFPRETIAKLLKQYFRYGQGRCRTSRKHKAFTSVRQVIPPIWTVLTLAILVMGLFSKFFMLPLLAYFFVLLLAAMHGTYKRRDFAILLSPVCFAVMHYAWGAGFFSELFRKSSEKFTVS
jgi:glycosyltransferase involved in cell wall biosynthesis